MDSYFRKKAEDVSYQMEQEGQIKVLSQDGRGSCPGPFFILPLETVSAGFRHLPRSG